MCVAVGLSVPKPQASIILCVTFPNPKPELLAAPTTIDGTDTDDYRACHHPGHLSIPVVVYALGHHCGPSVATTEHTKVGISKDNSS